MPINGRFCFSEVLRTLSFVRKLRTFYTSFCVIVIARTWIDNASRQKNYDEKPILED